MLDDQSRNVPALEQLVLSLCASYLIHAKANGAPNDSVARFHLGNGARLEAVNWMADLSDTGLRRSAGIMVNYLYRLERIAQPRSVRARAARRGGEPRVGARAPLLASESGTPDAFAERHRGGAGAA